MHTNAIIQYACAKFKYISRCFAIYFFFSARKVESVKMVEKKTFSGVDFWMLRSNELRVGVTALGAAVTDIHF